MSWRKRRLDDVADFCLGKMLDQKKNKGDLLPYLANVNVRWGAFDFDNLREMRFEQHELDRFGLEYGDIVMCEGGEPGRCAIWKEQVPGMMIQKALHRIRPHECIDHDFLYYTFLYKGRTGHFAPLLTGATIKHLPREKLAIVEIDVPPLPAQHRIAEILSAYDDLIENNRRRMALLEEAARQLYREWFVRLRFPGREHTRFSNGLPSTWNRVAIGDCVNQGMIELQTGPFGTTLRASDYAETGTPVINVRNIGYGTLRLDKLEFVPDAIVERLEQHVVKAGDIVFGRKGAVDRHVLIGPAQDGWMQGSDCIRLRVLADQLCPIFLSMAFREETHKQWMLAQCGNKATMASLNQEVIGRIPLIVPTQGLLQQFRGFASRVLAQIGTLQRQSEKAADARDLLLPRLMSGEIAA